jgi:hypothetical protein
MFFKKITKWGSAWKPIPERDLFMMCPTLKRARLRPMPAGFSIRNCRKSELDAWIDLQADDARRGTRWASTS